MFDPERDELLRRYRAAAPSAELRNRLTALQSTPRTWPSAAAAPVLFLVTCGVQISTERIYRALGNSVGPESSSSLDQLPALREALADDQLMRSTLEEEERHERELAKATAYPSDSEAAGSW